MFVPKANGVRSTAASLRQATTAVTEMVRRRLEDEGQGSAQIMVTEIECRDEGCVPIEVLVIIMGTNNRWAGKILKPMVEVTDSDVRELEIPVDIENYEESRVKPPTPPPLTHFPTEESTIQVPMRPTDTSVLSNLVPKVGVQVSSTSSSSSSAFTSSDDGSGVNITVRKELMKTKVSRSNIVNTEGGSMAMAPTSRHETKGGVRPRGCPCCDPDNMDNIIDSIMFNNLPP